MLHLSETILAEIPHLCQLCHLFPVMQANPAYCCTACTLAFRKQALSDRMLGMLADRGRRDPEWRIAKE